MLLPHHRYRLKPCEPTEHQVQDSIAQLLNVLVARGKVVWWHRMNTASGKLLLADGKTSQYMKFAFKGCPDIIGQLPDGRFLGIEVKRPSGKATIEQNDFIEKSKKNGGCTFVARSIDDVIRELKL